MLEFIAASGVDIKPIEMWQQVKTYETEESNSLVPLGKRERKQPVQSIYRGLTKISLGKWRNPLGEEPGNPQSDLGKPPP